MGAWSHLLLHLPDVKMMRVASRRMYGSPAAGSSTRFNKRTKKLLTTFLTKQKIILLEKLKNKVS